MCYPVNVNAWHPFLKITNGRHVEVSLRQFTLIWLGYAQFAFTDVLKEWMKKG